MVGSGTATLLTSNPLETARFWTALFAFSLMTTLPALFAVNGAVSEYWLLDVG